MTKRTMPNLVQSLLGVVRNSALPNTTRSAAVAIIRKVGTSDFSADKGVAAIHTIRREELLRMTEGSLRVDLTKLVTEPEVKFPLLSPEQLAEFIRVIDAKTKSATEPFPATLMLGDGNMGTAVRSNIGDNARFSVLVVNERKDTENIKYYYKGSDIAVEHEVAVIAVKPDQIESVLSSLPSDFLKNGGVIVSLAAGTSIATIKSVCPVKSAKVVRAMPNTPITKGCGVTGVYLPEDLQDQKGLVERMFGSKKNRIVYVKKEEDIDKVTALSGSGPAYFFLLAELIAKKQIKGEKGDIGEEWVFDQMRELAKSNFDTIQHYQPKKEWSGDLYKAVSEANNANEVKDLILSFAKCIYDKAVKMGFSDVDAKSLAIGTMEGAGTYGGDSELGAAELKRNVTSKKGTTAAALLTFGDNVAEEKRPDGYKKMEASSLSDLVSGAVDAAYRRAQEISKAPSATVRNAQSSPPEQSTCVIL